MDRDVVNDAPTVGIDLDRLPPLVAQVDVDPAVERRDAQIGFPPVAVEKRSRLDRLDCARHRFGVGRAASLAIVKKPQPAVESARPDLVGLTMRFTLAMRHGERGVSLALRIGEQLAFRRSELDQEARLRALFGSFALRLRCALRPPLRRGVDDHLRDDEPPGRDPTFLARIDEVVEVAEAAGGGSPPGP